MLIADSDLPPPPSSPPPPLTLDESIGVQSLALSSPNHVEEEVSLETLTVPSLVPVDYDEPFSDIGCLSDNYKRWTPNVSPGYDTDDESTSYQPLLSFIQDPPTMIDDEPTGVVRFLKIPFPFFRFFIYLFKMVSLCLIIIGCWALESRQQLFR